MLILGFRTQLFGNDKAPKIVNETINVGIENLLN